MAALPNAKHERFAQEAAKGKNASEAYVAAGYKENRQNAARLMTNDDIRTRVGEIQAKGAVRAEITIERTCDRLERIADLAITDKAYGAAVAATMGQAKVTGLIVDKIDAKVRRIEDMTLAELDAVIAAECNAAAEAGMDNSETTH